MLSLGTVIDSIRNEVSRVNDITCVKNLSDYFPTYMPSIGPVIDSIRNSVSRVNDIIMCEEFVLQSTLNKLV